ncbi:hypothetical protein J2S19_002647 [Metabacillus malikii]|uniref:DUF1961 family protein n=2 Tax=Metabacillus malikii TaxID=1504265 RepID=A0ABT9ZHJ6_9BACI|nr:hypothetical protein [Metabacillus malikii]
MSTHFSKGKCLYENPLSSLDYVNDWVLEGKANVTIMDNSLQLENRLEADKYGDKAHFVFWCPVQFPDEIIIEWEFSPLREPGLCMLFFSAAGRDGEDLFDDSLPKRTGMYPEYHSGGIDAYHLSYFRHKHREERAFRTCNLRKSFGFHLVASGADPLPPVEDAISPYYMKLVKYHNHIQFYINELLVLDWQDDGKTYGKVHKDGKIGFRQMAPMKAAYSNLKIYEAIKEQ